MALMMTFRLVIVVAPPLAKRKHNAEFAAYGVVGFIAACWIDPAFSTRIAVIAGNPDDHAPHAALICPAMHVMATTSAEYQYAEPGDPT